MTRYTGPQLYVSFKGIAITATPWRQFNPGFEEEVADSSGGGDALRVYIKTIDKLEPSLTYVFDDNAAGTAAEAVLKVGNEGTLLWGPYGTATGRPKWGVVARVTQWNQSHTYDDVIETEVKFSVISGSYVFYGGTALW